MNLKTFSLGGIHPPEQKITAAIPVTPLAIPRKVAILLSQHIGSPSEPVVAKGDAVKVGTLIAKATGFMSANVHSSVSGTVSIIDEVMTPSGYKKKAIFIEVAGDEWEESIDRSATLITETPLSAKQLVERIADAGIIGMGGAGFPTHVKLSVPENKTISWLIINGVECEPFLTADHRLMVERADEIVAGIGFMMQALSVKQAVIGIEANKPDAIKVMTAAVKKRTGITVQPLKVRYPQGAEKQLIKAITKREVPSGKLPMDVGCVVDNVGTAFAIYEAVAKNKPLFERIITVSGAGISKPLNLLARIGVSTTDLLEPVGGLPTLTHKVISGGPMMGKTLSSLDVPATKGTSGIVVITPSEANHCHRDECKKCGLCESANCIRCGRCVDACPMGLEPFLLEKLADKQRNEECDNEHILDCIECGACSFVCPANRRILDFIRIGKSAVARLRKERNQK